MRGDTDTEPLDGQMIYEKRYIFCTYHTYSISLIPSFNNRFKIKQMPSYGLVEPPHLSLQHYRDRRTDPFVLRGTRFPSAGCFFFFRVALSLELPSEIFLYEPE
jgi:hypothetical protein